MKQKLKTYMLLLLFFMKVGCFTFGGGWSILAQMEQEFIDKRRLITKQDLVELIAVGKSIPGVMIANVSMLFGYQSAGVFGGMCCMVGITIPAVVILSIVTVFYHSLKDNVLFSCALQGVGCIVVSIIANAILSMWKEALKDKFGFIVCGIAFLLCVFTDISNSFLIITGVLSALVWMGVSRYRLH